MPLLHWLRALELRKPFPMATGIVFSLSLVSEFSQQSRTGILVCCYGKNGNITWEMVKKGRWGWRRKKRREKKTEQTGFLFKCYWTGRNVENYMYPCPKSAGVRVCPCPAGKSSWNILVPIAPTQFWDAVRFPDFLFAKWTVQWPFWEIESYSLCLFFFFEGGGVGWLVLFCFKPGLT